MGSSNASGGQGNGLAKQKGVHKGRPNRLQTEQSAPADGGSYWAAGVGRESIALAP